MPNDKPQPTAPITPQEMIDHLQLAKYVTVDANICDAIIAFIKEHSDAKDD